MCKVVNFDGIVETIASDPSLQKHAISFCPHCRKAVFVMWLRNPPGSVCHNCGGKWNNHIDWLELFECLVKKKNDQKLNDGSVAGMFLGLLIGLFIPNVAIMCGLPGEVIIFISFVTLLCGFVWTNDNLPIDNNGVGESDGDKNAGGILPDPGSKPQYAMEEEFMVGRTPNHWLGYAIERFVMNGNDDLNADSVHVPQPLDYWIETPVKFERKDWERIEVILSSGEPDDD